METGNTGLNKTLRFLGPFPVARDEQAYSQHEIAHKDDKDLPISVVDEVGREAGSSKFEFVHIDILQYSRSLVVYCFS